MVGPKTENVSSLDKEEIKNALTRVFEDQAPNATKIPKGVYFTVSHEGKRIFYGHLEANGVVDVFWSDSDNLP
ncbi:MAG: hypothetical protein A2564_01295 [Candidatus Wildermuthbacteria bacterium RIFOXYD1_FULL_50_12]|nr:MAG: hypothetical protein A2564_01295 [Candidatus Wildermuthbacteria bacterium RIFOXYD1_FULL_50_12]